MNIIDPLPRPVRETEHAWIPISDGTRLAARIWMPDDAVSAPVPAILEYIPYRRRDNTRARDDIMHPWFAAQGYACVRVDLRGSGDSEGVLEDEYLQRELDDGVEIIRWIAAQDWCDGNVGMIGISWGGFNGLQIAALRPPELKAVVSVASTDDRFADDVHHMGGCLLGDNLSWASTMFGFNSLPPDPEVVGDRWRDMWFQRLQGSGLWLEKWLRHQRRDSYWQHGSVCEDWDAIQCPVMAVSGWADGYTNSVFRLLANLRVPRLGLVGPWSHKYPHLGIPGPAIGFLQECLRWWDKWLKGIETGIMDEPMLRAWMQDYQPPITFYKERPGRWVGERQWPSPQIHERSLVLARPGSLEWSPAQVDEAAISIQSPLSVGLFAGKWCSYAATPDLPHDQREEDGGALVFDSPRLKGPLEILGAVRLELEIAASRPVAMLAVRLSDVAPDDKATRVTYGLLNLTHRDGPEDPRPLEPGKHYRVELALNDIAHAFPAGNRLRLSISTSYFPLAWPAPEPVRLTLFTGTSRMVLPERPRRDAEDRAISFPPPEGARPLPVRRMQSGQHKWRVIRDLETDISTLEVTNDDGEVHIEPVGLDMQRRAMEWYSYQGYDYSSPKGETLWEWGFRRGDWQVRTVTRTVLDSTPSHFRIHAELDAYEGGKRVYSDNWDVEIPRDLV
ncbi:CocE/NonD family hydrolase [Microbulbifer yueqingensis]|uniref:Xaa-Pro dipeptidyl-peptidase C-terminal domain-containing protein n=1 Tax=Microbulbifer yueqingensis TaxID=658219 RepID=A0A1G8VFP4_9GAMM|nr:CocE/NonD family hydrolase [Microbulbifer yueqingensis]SDJ64734.1 hypothetical protein SAMN05216212_0543 [Microbulbifer yueqingensis]